MNRKTSTGEFIVSDHDKDVIVSLLAKVKQATQDGTGITVITHKSLSRILNSEEMGMIDRVYTIEPTRYGFKGPKFAIEPVPDNLVKVDPQPYQYKGVQCYTKTQFIPEAPYKAYRLMADAMKTQINRTLLIAGSYRSDVYQAILFLSILKLDQFDVSKTAKRVAIPGYSEHGTPTQLAFDFQNVDGLPSDETPQDFEGTEEHDWLMTNAARFSFSLSYPKDNALGVMFEPWHWRYMPKTSL